MTPRDAYTNDPKSHSLYSAILHMYERKDGWSDMKSTLVTSKVQRNNAGLPF